MKNFKKIRTPFFIIIIISGLLIAFSCNYTKNTQEEIIIVTIDSTDATNNFYDNAETFPLKCTQVEIIGEVSNPGVIDFSKLPKHCVIVKETLLDGESDKFVGAYRYNGYSLFDILNLYALDKNNADVFSPIIDLYVEVENESGEKVVVSWGEIYYPNHLNEIIIATDVMRIVPSKTNELWPLPTDCKLVIVSDLITERNISNPTKITVKSFPINLEVEKGKDPLYSPKVDLYVDNTLVETLTENPKNIPEENLHTIFYGRGRGIHSTQPFSGVELKNILNKIIKRTPKSLCEGLVVIGADDGYRATFTLSEIINRNDQADVLLICDPEVTNNGIFRLFPSCDFFSDRAVKGINAIYYSHNTE